MELYRFDKETGKRITKFNSDFVMSRIIQTEKKRARWMYAPGSEWCNRLFTRQEFRKSWLLWQVRGTSKGKEIELDYRFAA